MTEHEAHEELKRFIETQPTGPQWRTCAICLSSIAREYYNEHLQQAHGYETIVLTQVIPEQK